ncbi:MAG TPA: hypothetical protein VEU08_17170 [Vicinamibacterales bacterium]|nr:hypothetical protein [Vicinamibacterales bacterium]
MATMTRTRKIEALTREQEAQLPVFRDKWIAIGLSTAPAERPKAETAIRLAYRRAGLEEPATLLWLGSPMAGAIGYAFLQELRRRLQSKDQSVHQSVAAPVGASVWASVWASVRASVGDCGYGQHDANWIGFLDAFRSFGLKEETERIDGLTQLTESCGWYWPFKGLCILTERHSELRRDERGRLHSENAAAVKYPDGWSIYAWHGVRVAEAVILRPETITVEQIHKEPNAEIRRVLLERYSFDRYIADSGAQPIHTDETGTLYRCELVDDEPLVVVRVKNATPEPTGEFKNYVLRVPPDVRTARAAVAWTFNQKPRSYKPVQET